jgi:hypothetical protein
MSGDDSDHGPRGNAAYPWGQFDPEVYFQQYYAEPHADDDRVVRMAADALKQASPDGNDLSVLDVGTGPSLIPFLCALPRARRLTAWEYSEPNIAWLKDEMARSELRAPWRHFWKTARDAYGVRWELPDDPAALLRERSTITQGSIFDLPAGNWDAATMFFCAESITKRQDEFEAACVAFARSVRRGGTLAAAFLVRSEGYVVADQLFPALKLSPEAIERVFTACVDNVRCEAVGIVDREIRSGYSGQLFLTGTAR